MSINFSKTKEMVMSLLAIFTNLSMSHCADGQIECINSFKLLGLI